MDFKFVPKEYRPIPFWSWNSKLTTEETRRQAEMMNEAGMGGYFMHARGGLITDYMGDEWFENVDEAAKVAEETGMQAWFYDENGWPSGFGNGMVNGLGEKYQQKYLRMEKGEGNTDRTICNEGGYHFYYDVNPFYVDTLDVEVTREFIDKVYAPYYEKFGNRLKGAFTDEPQLSRDGIPWSLTLPEKYEERYGEAIYPRLVELFLNIGDYENTRIKFWKLITDLFSQNFCKEIYDWCTERNLEFTGHMVCEDSLLEQLTTNGAAMPHYEYLTMPGIDWLGRPIGDGVIGRQLGSVAQQLGKKRVLTESFALCGHNVSFDELRRILEWQMVRGVNILCPHLEGYTIAGIRKRDYPPAMYYQQPWWKDYKEFINEMSRIGMIMGEGKVSCSTLLIHPQTAAWTCFNNDKNEGLEELSNLFVKTIDILDGKHVEFHLGDETIMERHAEVKDGKIIIGTQKYDKVIVIDNERLLDTTKALLREYKNEGGVITTAEAIEKNDIIDDENITYTKRTYDGFCVHYFVNSTDKILKTKIKSGSKMINIKTGELEPLDKNHVFMPYDSLLVYDDGTECTPNKKELKQLKTDGVWNVTNSTYNALTLDYCDYYFDGKLEERHGYILSVQGRACKLERPVNVRCVFNFNVKTVSDTMYLVCETPEIFDISVNGNALKKTDCGYFVDKSFRKIDIAEYVKEGNNVIEMTVDFKQSDEVYENLRKSAVFESEKNKLKYDMEIEPIYIIGDFGVYAENEPCTLERNAYRYEEGFYIDKAPKNITLTEIEKQGYLFFVGELTVEKEFDLMQTDYMLRFCKTGANALRIKVNGVELDTVLWNMEQVDLSEYLKIGKNKIEITIVNNLRNLLGPHHLAEGEGLAVGPHSFFKELCIWNMNNAWGVDVDTMWNDGYCFTEISVSDFCV